MAKGYVVVVENIHDQAGYQGYVAKAGGTIAAYGGRLLILSDDAELIEGEWPWQRTLVLEFPSVEKAHEWYNSPEYQAIVGERHASADANTVIVGGFEMPG